MHWITYFTKKIMHIFGAFAIGAPTITITPPLTTKPGHAPAFEWASYAGKNKNNPIEGSVPSVQLKGSQLGDVLLRGTVKFSGKKHLFKNDFKVCKFFIFL